MACNKNKLYKTLDYWSRDRLNFDFLKKGLSTVYPSYFVYDCSRKLFLMLHSINWPHVIFWLHLLLEILHSMCNAIVCFPGCDVVNFENNLIFLIKEIPKSQNKNVNILRMKSDFDMTNEAIFIIFKGLSVVKNCLRHESAPFKFIFIYQNQCYMQLYIYIKIMQIRKCT